VQRERERVWQRRCLSCEGRSVATVGRGCLRLLAFARWAEVGAAGRVEVVLGLVPVKRVGVCRRRVLGGEGQRAECQ
jgi:hypothetical protein